MPVKAPVRAMPKFRKPSAALVELFGQTIVALPGVAPRQMFGCPCAFIHGNMFAGVFDESIFLRLAPAERMKFAKLGALPFEPLPGRVMREYVVVPPAILQSKTRLNHWLEKSFAYAAALPPKARKPKASKGKNK